MTSSNQSVDLALAKLCRYEMSLSDKQKDSMSLHGCISAGYLGELWRSECRPREDEMLSYIDNSLESMVRLKFKLSKEFEDLERSILKNISVNSETSGWLFITIGYDDKVAKPADMKRIIHKVKNMKAMKYTSFRYVHEKHRKDKDGKIYHHLHTHILCRTPFATKGKFLQLCYPARCRSFLEGPVAGKNFVDVKTPKDGHTYSGKLKYIEGDKTDDKLECIRLDKLWRSEHDLHEVE